MDSKLPRISIITPSYNQGQFMEATVQSALNQSYPNSEYIVIDGYSTIQAMGLVNYYKSQINIIHEKDKGQSDDINKELKMAKGESFGWLTECGIFFFIFHLGLIFHSLYQLTKYYKLNTSFVIPSTFDSLFSKIFFNLPHFYFLVFNNLKMSTQRLIPYTC